MIALGAAKEQKRHALSEIETYEERKNIAMWKRESHLELNIDKALLNARKD